MRPSDWYEQVNGLLAGDKHRLAALAALSPRLSIRANFRALRQLETLGDTTLAFPANVHKARRILSGEAPLTVLGGAKVRAFYRSLMLVPGAVCVDNHMLQWGGCRRDQFTKRNVEHVDKQVRAYAKLWLCETYQAQAGIWLAVVGPDARQSPAVIFTEEML